MTSMEDSQDCLKDGKIIPHFFSKSQVGDNKHVKEDAQTGGPFNFLAYNAVFTGSAAILTVN